MRRGVSRCFADKRLIRKPLEGKYWRSRAPAEATPEDACRYQIPDGCARRAARRKVVEWHSDT